MLAFSYILQKPLKKKMPLINYKLIIKAYIFIINEKCRRFLGSAINECKKSITKRKICRIDSLHLV